MKTISVCFAINNGYSQHLSVAISSLLFNNKGLCFDIFILSNGISSLNEFKIKSLQKKYDNLKINFINVDDSKLKNLKLNISHITIQTYYRYLIADILPSLDKVLYLDADLVVNGDIESYWDTDISDFYAAGVSDLFIESNSYKSKIGFNEEDLYVNAGSMLFNLKKIRENDKMSELINNTISYSDKIEYQDQDIINITFKGMIKEINSIYNFTSMHVKRQKELRSKAVVVHYTGAVKPWTINKKCKNKLKHLYRKYLKMTAYNKPKNKIKVGLIIDEFFGGAGTAYGGYGFLARKYIAKYIPDEDFEVDVLLGKGKNNFTSEEFKEDEVSLYRLPRRSFFAKRWLRKKDYDVYLSIELVDDYVLKHEMNPNKKLILWVQDPRPKSAWDNVINTMESIKDPSFFNPKVYEFVNKWHKEGRVKYISQGASLNELAFELYNIPKNTSVKTLENPIDIDFNYEFKIDEKKKNIIFLGRLEAQKRAWLFCEIAKRMPEYNFYVIGQFFRYKDDNQRMLKDYIKDFDTMESKVSNLHFVGHLDGEEKHNLIKESRVLLSTAIWEGIPISWLECLSYGTILVSALEREGLAEKFGEFVGNVPGDGFNGVDKFIPALKKLMENDDEYSQKAKSAIEYTRNHHSIKEFIKDMKQVIIKGIL